MTSVVARREADARRRARQPYRKLFDHIRQGCRNVTPRFSARMVGILGYDYEAFRSHIEGTFEDGMTWAGFLNGDVHIDHILPLASFRPDDLPSITQAWALKNIRAAWPADNLAKLKLDHAVIAMQRQTTPPRSGTLLAA